jgi:hypothetical protein
MYQPEILSEKNDAEIIEFLNDSGKNNPAVLGYHYPNYRNMLEKIGVGDALYIGVRNPEGKLIALFPGFIKTQPEGTVYSSLPFFGPNSGIICSLEGDTKKELYKSTLSFLMDHFDNYEMVSASIYSNFFDNTDVHILEEYLTDPIVVDKFTNYLQLENLKLSSVRERNIRKAIKSGVKIRSTTDERDVDEIFEIYKQNCDDYGIPPKPKECLSTLIKQGESFETTKTYIAEYENCIIGALIMIYSPLTASYYLPCSKHEFRPLQPTTLLIKHAIEESKENGIKIWNWESSPSKDSGVYKFKRDWGSVDGYYKVFVKTYKPNTFFKQLGKEEISRLYPYYFVFPFNLM